MNEALLTIDPDIIKDFLTESDDIMTNLEKDLLELSDKGSDNPNLNSIINNIFRYVHTLKGTAGFIGLDALAKLAHSMENLFDKLRNHELSITEEMSDIFFKGFDILKEMLGDIYKSNSIIIEPVTNKLESFLKPVQKPAKKTKEKTFVEETQKSQNQTNQNGKTETKIIAKKEEYQGESKPIKSNQKAVAESNENAVSKKITVDLSKIDIKQYSSMSDFIEMLIKKAENKNAVINRIYLDDSDIPPFDFSDDKLPDFINGQNAEIEIEITGAAKIETPDSSTEQNETGETETTLNNTQNNKSSQSKEPIEKSGFKNDNPQNNFVDESESQKKLLKKEPENMKTQNNNEFSKEIKSVKTESSSKNADTKSQNNTLRNEIEADKVIRVKVTLLDKLMDLAGELVLVRNQQMQLLDTTSSDPRLTAISQQLNFVTSQLQESIMATRMEPIGKVFNRFPRVVKDLSKELNKKVNLEIYGQEVELDKNIIEAIGDPLVHILRNSLDHGLECPEVRERKGKPQVGKIILKAYHLGGQVIIDIIDDGSGINIEKVKEKIIANNLVSYEELEKMPEKEIMMFIMKPGFSTAETVSKVSGRGVGMDVVKSTIEKLGGRADIDSVFNEGTTLRLKLPLTLAIVPCMITRVEDYFFAIPQVNIVEIVWLYGKDVYQKIEKIQDNEIFRLRDILLPLVRLSSILKIQKKYVDPDTKEIKEERRINLTDRRKNKSGETENAADDFSDQRTIDDRRNSIDNSLYIIVCRINQNLLGLIVDEAIDTEEIVVKSIHDEIKKNRCYAGATVLGDGKIALILDVPGIAETAKLNFNSSESAIQKKQNISSAGDIETQTIFLFKNHPEEIFGIFLSLIARISVIKSNQIKRIGGKEFFIHNNESIPLIRIENFINVGKPDKTEDLFMIIPKLNKKAGLICSEILDTIELAVELKNDMMNQKGIMGSFVLNNESLVNVIDIFSIIEMYSPDFFSGTSKSAANPANKNIDIFKNKKILLVEDTPFFMRTIEGYLKQEHFEVVTAENGIEALQRLENENIDLILSDIEMPKMNGLELITEIRKNDKFKRIPAIAVSALKSDIMMKRALSAGYDSYQEKLNKEKLFQDLQDKLTGINA